MTAALLAPISLAEFAARMAAHGSTNGGVAGLVADTDDLPPLARELAQELEFIADRPTTLVAASNDINATIAELAKAGDSALILYGFEAVHADVWAALDELRNKLDPRAGLILLMNPGDFEHLQDRAPNLSSWLGGRVWRWSDEGAKLSRGEIQERLATLRAAFGKTDEEVLAAARSGTLPPEPEYAEWVILLGQGDLLR